MSVETNGLSHAHTMQAQLSAMLASPKPVTDTPQQQATQVAVQGATPEILAQMQAMMAQIEALKTKLAQRSGITYKVGPKGGLCIYGLQRKPYHLYLSQAERLVEEIKSGRFESALEKLRPQLKVKGEDEE